MLLRKKKTIHKQVVIIAALAGMTLGASVSISHRAEAGCTCCAEIFEALATSIPSSISFETIWKESFEKWFEPFLGNVSKNFDSEIQANALAKDAVIKTQVNIENQKIVNDLRASPERCTTENFGMAVVDVDKNENDLRNSLNDKLVEYIDAGEDKPVARAKADVLRASEDGDYGKFDTVMHITDPVMPYNTENERAAAKAYIDRVVESVSLPPISTSQKQTNKGILYKKARLDYMATVQLLNNGFSDAVARNTAQPGLIESLRSTIDAEDQVSKRLLQDKNNNNLSAASKNTLMAFEMQRRLSSFWQQKVGELGETPLTREMANILALKNYALKEEFDINIRNELLIATWLAQELKDSGDRARLEALYASFN